MESQLKSSRAKLVASEKTVEELRGMVSSLMAENEELKRRCKSDESPEDGDSVGGFIIGED